MMNGTTARINTIHLQAASLNRRGVYMLASNEYTQALDMFNQALAAVDQLLLEEDVMEPDNSHSLPRKENETSASIIMEIPHCMGEEDDTYFSPSSCCEYATVPIVHLKHDNFCLFNEAFLFYPDVSEEDEEEEEDYVCFTFYSAIIVFNMALCYHTMARTKNNGECLRTANGLYHSSYHIMSDVLSCDNDDDDAGTATHLLLAASLNNQALIYYDLMDPTYERLLKEMARLLQSNKCLLKASRNSYWKNILWCPKTFYASPSA